MKRRILIADDHKILRNGLSALLRNQSDLELVGEAENGQRAVELAKELRPDVVIMDIAMPGLNGVEAARRIVAEAPGVKVIALSMHSDRRFVTRMLEAGASGYLLKDSAFEELAFSIRTVVEDQIYLSPGITGVVIEDYVQRLSASPSSDAPVLTAREREVLQLLAEGRSTREIANQLHVSAKTVETHRKHIMDRLKLRSIAELTKYAIREGLTSLE
jgi:two-component system response regulator NreC